MRNRQILKVNNFKTYKTEAREPKRITNITEDTKVIVFQQQIQTLQHYFQFMRDLFGHTTQQHHTNLEPQMQKVGKDREAVFDQYKSSRGKSLAHDQDCSNMLTRTTRSTWRKAQDNKGKDNNRQILDKFVVKGKRKGLGSIIKGTTRSRHSFMMSKLQNSKLIEQQPLRVIEKMNSIQTIEQFVPIGKIENKTLKYQRLGTNINEQSLHKLQKNTFSTKGSRKKQLVLITQPNEATRPSTSIRTIHARKYSTMHPHQQRLSFVQLKTTKNYRRGNQSVLTPWDAPLMNR